jgi:pimeloyl-ACP methyl ester carboxylesterase
VQNPRVKKHLSPSTSNPSALVLLPGLMCDHTFWAPLQAAVPPSLACQVVDYGDADTLTAMAEAALAVAPPQFALAGHSMGGRVAMEVVRLAPQRVQKLILMDTGYLPLATGEAGVKERAGRMALLEVAKTTGVRAMCGEWLKGMVHPARLNDTALLEEITAMFARKNADRFARQLNALLTRPDACPVLASLRDLALPTMLLCGRQDSWANVAQHEAMQALATDARLCVIEDAGHMVLMERPAETARAILQFLESSQ